MKQTVLAAGAILLLLAAALSAGQRSRGEARAGEAASAETQWEYLIVAGGRANLSTAGNDQYDSMRKQPDTSFSREWFPLERNLDKLGAKGWELVSVSGPPNDPIFYLKRPKSAGK